MRIPGLLATVSTLICNITWFSGAAVSDELSFEHVTIDDDIGAVCYAVKLIDINGDKKDDIVAVTENRVLWYENPSWKKRTIIEDQTERDNVCIAATDIDGDGQVDLALGAGWTKVGTLQWLSRNESLDQPWNLYEIGSEPWLHRMHFADVNGTGKPQLVISPLNKTQGNGVRLIAFSIPSDPKTDRWLPTLMNAELDRMHNHLHEDFDGDGSIDTLTASQEGISLIRKEGEEWTRKELTPNGAGEIKTGSLGDRRFIATVEPMHGTDVAVYFRDDSGWKRHEVDNALKQGHAIVAVDVNGDDRDELIVGHREKADGEIAGPGLYVYQAKDESGTQWTKHVIDNGGIAVEDAVAGDLNGDGKVDIVAGGRGTRNLKLYWNKN